MNFVKTVIEDEKNNLEKALKMYDNHIDVLEKELTEFQQRRVVATQRLEECNKFLNV